MLDPPINFFATSSEKNRNKILFYPLLVFCPKKSLGPDLKVDYVNAQFVGQTQILFFNIKYRRGAILGCSFNDPYVKFSQGQSKLG